MIEYENIRNTRMLFISYVFFCLKSNFKSTSPCVNLVLLRDLMTSQAWRISLKHDLSDYPRDETTDEDRAEDQESGDDEERKIQNHEIL